MFPNTSIDAAGAPSPDRQHEASVPVPVPERAHKSPPVEGRTVTSGQYACPECDGRYKRQEHLNRHILSLHRGEDFKPHLCNHCGKRFSRRDVLLRHLQSCMTSKAAKSRIEEERSNWKPSVQIDDSTISLDSHSAQKQSFTIANLDFDPNQVTEGSDRSALAIEPQGPTEPVLSEQANNGAQEDAFSDPNNQTRHINDHSDVNNSGGAVAPSFDLPPKTSKASYKRGRYTSNACMNCQKRKIKCTGEENCPQCCSSGLPCTYNNDRKRRNTTGGVARSRYQDQTSELDTDTGSRAKAAPSQDRKPSTAETQKLSDSLEQLMARIGSLERDRNMYKNHCAVGSSDQDASEEQWRFSELDYDMQSDSGDSITSLPPNEVNFGATSLFESMQVLNRTVTVDGEGQLSLPSDSDSVSTPAPIRWDRLRYEVNKDVRKMERETTRDIATIRNDIDTFFTNLNPHYPSLNENQFRAQLETFLAGEDLRMSSGDRQQFIALINLMQAEVRILIDDRPGLSQVPGWDQFCRAESLLHRLTWLGKGNILTIQCLICKARYLLYLERAGSAYHVMGHVVQLCFQLGLHNQSSWKDCSPFDIAMRQRIFWTILYLERNVSINSGSPYLIREADFKVGLLPALDDKLMFPGKPLPAETPHRSFAPYLMSAVKWGKLGSEIWDVVFGINAERPTSQEFVATMDARIGFITSQLPVFLQWEKRTNFQACVDETNDVPHYVHRQALILYLRMNQLRLLPRQEIMLSLDYDNRTAEDCVSIAGSSIDAIAICHKSPFFRLTDRFSSVLYLIICLLPLVCVIIKKDNPQQTRQKAIAAFQTGHGILKEMAPNYHVARHALRRSDRIFTSVLQAIERDGLSPSEPGVADAVTPVPQYTDFFNDLRIDLDWNMLGQTSDGPVTYGNDMCDAVSQDFDANGNEWGALWSGGFVNKSSSALPFT